MKTNKKGISLIVLVITIIVMIILAAAIILSLNSSNIVERANEATLKSDIKTMQEELAVVLAEAELRGTPNQYEGMPAEDVLDSAKKYEGKYIIQNGKLVEKSNEPVVEYSPASWFEFDDGIEAYGDEYGTITNLTTEGKQQTKIIIPKEIDGVEVLSIFAIDSQSVTEIYAYHIEEFMSTAGLGTPNLEYLYLGKSISSIGWGVFDGAPKLTAINYEGTMEEWSRVYLNEELDWNKITQIICSDGTITL